MRAWRAMVLAGVFGLGCAEGDDGTLLPICDADGDGIDGPWCGGDDCDDTLPEAYPGADEACDGLDTDCDGEVPGDEVDGDVDGFRVCDGDCADNDVNTYPGGPSPGQDCDDSTN